MRQPSNKTCLLVAVALTFFTIGYPIVLPPYITPYVQALSLVLAIILFLWAGRVHLLEAFGAVTKVQFDRVYSFPAHIDGKPTGCSMTQVWFKNESADPTAATTAKRVTARLELLDSLSSMARLKAHGQWVLATAAGHGGYTGTTDMVDLPPGLISAKLNVLLKYDGEESAYLYSRENVHAYRDGRHPSFEVPRGRWRLRIKLLGLNIDQQFMFSVNNSEPDAQPAVSPIKGG
jgi:hypothetical protein